MNQRNTKVRIDFVVRETCDDGSVPEEELRFVRFGDEASTFGVRDFFQRVGHAIGLMFPSCGTQAVAFTNPGPNKIAVIKVLREMGGYGLKEAKDLVEAPLGNAVLLVKDHRDVPSICAAFGAAGAKVDVSPFLVQERPVSLGPNGLPAPAEYLRPR